jgi:hypothetical protein
MRHLQVQTVDELLKNIDKPKLIEAEIIEYIVILRNPPHSLAYQTRRMYLSAIVMFYAMNDVNLNRKKNCTIPWRADNGMSRPCLYHRRDSKITRVLR